MAARLLFEKPLPNSSPKFLRKPRRKLLQKLRAIRRTLRALLLVLDDAAADFEVGHHLEGVHDGGHAAPGLWMSWRTSVRRVVRPSGFVLAGVVAFLETDGFFMDQAG